MELVDDFLVEPGRELRVKLTLQRFPKEAFRIEDLVGVVLEVLEVLLRQDPANDLFLSRALLLVGLPVLQLAAIELLPQPGLVGL